MVVLGHLTWVTSCPMNEEWWVVIFVQLSGCVWFGGLAFPLHADVGGDGARPLQVLSSAGVGSLIYLPHFIHLQDWLRALPAESVHLHRLHSLLRVEWPADLKTSTHMHMSHTLLFTTHSMFPVWAIILWTDLLSRILPREVHHHALFSHHCAGELQVHTQSHWGSWGLDHRDRRSSRVWTRQGNKITGSSTTLRFLQEIIVSKTFTVTLYKSNNNELVSA